MVMGNPFPLKANAGKSFQGSIVLGKGFIIETKQAQALIAKDKRNKEVLFPYLNGDDLNNDHLQRPSRWVINFFDWPEEKARTYSDCFEIVEKLVKPERLAQNDKIGKEKWWRFLRARNELYETISKLDQVMVLTRVSKYVVVEMVDSNQVFMEKVVVKTFQEFSFFSILQSSLYNEWAWKYSSTLGSGTINYSPSTCFDTFPFPQTDIADLLNEIGQELYSLRQSLMKKIQLGLTKIYNQFHNSKLNKVLSNEELEDIQFEKRYGKDSQFLKKHLHSLNSITYNETLNIIEKLRNLQIKMDLLVLKSYNWMDIKLEHGFYELDYLPENDRIRFTIHPEARKEVLKRLLKLNHQMYNAQIKSDKHVEKKVKTKNDNSSSTLF